MLSSRGDAIIYRDCILYNSVRGDLTKNTPETFFRSVRLHKGDAPPIFVNI
jgi:AP-4 complex subunit mu-1